MRTQNSLFNFLLQNAKSVVVLLLAFFITPILVGELGNEVFGSFRVILEFLSHFSLIEFGLFAGVSALFNEAISRSENERLNSLFVSSSKEFTKVMYRAFGFAIPVAIFIYFFVAASEARIETALAFLVTAVTLVFLRFRSYQAYLEANQKSYLVSLSYTVQNVIFILSSFLFAVLGFKFFAQPLAFLISHLILNIALIALSKRFVRFDRLAPISENSTKEIGKTKWPFFVSQLTGRFSLYSDTIILSFVLGPIAVTQFFLSGRFVMMIFENLQSFSSSIWASLADLYHQKEEKKFEEYLRFLTNMSAFIAMVFLAPLLGANDVLIKLWVGPEHYVGQVFTIIIVFNALIQPVLSLWGWVFSFSKKLNLLVPYMIIGTIFNIILSLYFTYTKGIIGPVLGTLTTYAIITFLAMAFNLRKHFKTNWSTLLNWLWAFPFMAILGIVARNVVILFPVKSWVDLVVFFPIMFIFNAFVLYFLFLTKADRQIVLEKIRFFFRKR